MGWFELIPHKTFRKLFHKSLNINSLLVLEFIGELDFGLGGGISNELELPEELIMRIRERIAH